MPLNAQKINKRKFELIECAGIPVAAKFITNNTEIYSAFSNKSIVTFLKKGSIRLFNGKDVFSAKTGDCFLTLKYSDYKVQRILDFESGSFESIVFVMHDLNTEKGPSSSEEITESERAMPIFKIESEILSALFKDIDDHFIKKNIFTSNEFEYIKNTIVEVVESTLDEQPTSLRDRNESFLSFLHAHITKNLTLDKLASKYGLSRSSFYRLFVKEIGSPPYTWIKDQRLHHARCEMQLSQKTISQIYLDLGFEDMAHFSKEFKKKFGYNPSYNYDTAVVEILK